MNIMSDELVNPYSIYLGKFIIKDLKQDNDNFYRILDSQSYYNINFNSFINSLNDFLNPLRASFISLKF